MFVIRAQSMIYYYFGGYMINGNDYDCLTLDGVHNLFSEPMEGQQFVMQVMHFDNSHY